MDHVPRILAVPRRGRRLLLATILAVALASALASGGSHAPTTLAIHAMPCYDLDGDNAVSWLDVDIESSYLFIDIGHPDYEPATDLEGDGLIRVQYDMVLLGLALGTYANCQDTPVFWNGGVPPKGGGGNPLDLDGDGCPDLDENGPSELQGGLRSYTNPWDYWNPSQDGQNRVDDILLVLSAYGGTASVYTDRTLIGPNPWNLGPPDRAQTIQDVLYQVYQYFHDC